MSSLCTRIYILTASASFVRDIACCVMSRRKLIAGREFASFCAKVLF